MNIDRKDAIEIAAQLLAKKEIDHFKDEDDIIESDLLVGIISESMRSISTDKIKKLPRVIDDGFLRTEDAKALIESVDINYRAIASEIDSLNAVSEVIKSIVDKTSTNLHEAIMKAYTSVSTLAAYHAALDENNNAITVRPEHLDGNFTPYGDTITSGISSARDASITIQNIETNGAIGNLLELKEDIEKGRSLQNSEINFMDEDGSSKNKYSLTDKDELTVFEIEAYKTPEVYALSIPTNESELPWFLFKMTKSNTSSEGEVSIEEVKWWEGPSTGVLYADMTLKVASGSVSVVNIDLADKRGSNNLAIPFAIVDRVDVSKDGTEWEVADAHNDVSVMNGLPKISIIINKPNANFIRVRVRQAVPYNSTIVNAAHWVEPKDSNEKYWLSTPTSPAYRVDRENKRSFFEKKSIRASSGDMLNRHVFGIGAERYAICIKDIEVVINEYDSVTTFESENYFFDSGIKTAVISADELIPEGTSIEYFISPDQKMTWYPLAPIQRSGDGAEVIMFGEGGIANPNIQSTIFVPITNNPKSLAIKGILKARKNMAPSIRSLSIVPTFSE